MTTYTAITAGEIDSDSPITDTLLARLRDNPIAIAEGDATVPANLLQSLLLGTLTTTSGSTRTLSSLTLTPYKFLIFSLNGVSTTSSGALTIGSASNITVPASSSVSAISGFAFVDLGNGIITAMTSELGGGSVQSTKAAPSGYTTATTSVSISTSATFDAGSVSVYGVK